MLAAADTRAVLSRGAPQAAGWRSALRSGPQSSTCSCCRATARASSPLPLQPLPLQPLPLRSLPLQPHRSRVHAKCRDRRLQGPAHMLALRIRNLNVRGGDVLTCGANVQRQPTFTTHQQWSQPTKPPPWGHERVLRASARRSSRCKRGCMQQKTQAGAGTQGRWWVEEQHAGADTCIIGGVVQGGGACIIE